MTPTTCPVNAIVNELGGLIQDGRMVIPKGRRLAEEIHALLQDIAWGRAGKDHLPAIVSLLGELAGDDLDDACHRCAAAVEDSLNTYRETFDSHIKTRNCATGECVKLVPAPCQMTCPAGIDVPSYVNLIAMGRDDEAIEVIRKDNPFPWVCGLVCTRPCELMCVRGRIDTPISIKFLKGYAAEKALSDRTYQNPRPQSPNGRKVAVIGAGPAGMSAAYYLALKGYEVRVIEAQPMAGGMMMLGIPRYRLPREVIDREVAMIQDLGVTFQFNTRFGRDVEQEQLQQEGFEAFLFTIGAHNAFKLGIPGENEWPQVIDAIDFLRRVALGDHQSPGRRVIVVGGGNVAIDAARTSLRLGSEAVTIAYRRTRREMPADIEEVEQAEEEGIRMDFLTVPVEVCGDGRVTGLTCLRAELQKREGSERLFPVPVEGSEHTLDADAIICAIGQRVDADCMKDLDAVKWTRRNTIETKRVSMDTAQEGVFAAGDSVTGPATIVEAIGGGKRAAAAIDRYLSGIPQPKVPLVPVRRRRTDWLEVPATTKMVLKRPEMPLLNIERRRTTFQQVELGYNENSVREEARRCLRCDVCLRCGTCVEVCRDKMGIDALQLGYLDFDDPGFTDFRVAEERCILCGACAANCPNDAIRIEDRDGERILSLCGTILNRQPLLMCHDCGATLGPARYLDYVRKRTAAIGRLQDQNDLCDACARQKSAAAHAEHKPARIS